MNTNERCERCGMPRNEWKGNHGDGVTRQSHAYCCDGCANGTGCTCQ